MKVILVLPAYNEESMIVNTVEQLDLFCKNNLTQYRYQIIIADNASTDGTGRLGAQLAERIPSVAYELIATKGKGVAIREAWQRHPADIYCFMDADLATDLKALPTLVEAVANGAAAAIGSRYHKDSRVKRSRVRLLFSWGYRQLVRAVLGTKLQDLACGFKAVNGQVIAQILPEVKDQEWFFDSELILRIERKELQVIEVPVEWEDVREAHDPSRVNIISVALNYAKKLMVLRRWLSEK